MQKRVEGAPKVKKEEIAQPAAPVRQAGDTAALSSAPAQKSTDGPTKAAAPAVQAVGEQDGTDHVRAQEGADPAKDHAVETAPTDGTGGSRPQSDTGAPVLANGNAPADGARKAVRPLLAWVQIKRSLLPAYSVPVSVERCDGSCLLVSAT